jgi:hypothetical protein
MAEVHAYAGAYLYVYASTGGVDGPGMHVIVAPTLRLHHSTEFSAVTLFTL